MGDVLELAVRIVLSLGAVLGLMWLLARMTRKPMKRRTGSPVSVLARQQLSRHASVAVVEVGGRALVVGVTEQRVTLLADTDLAAVTDAEPTVETAAETVVEPALEPALETTAGTAVAGRTPALDLPVTLRTVKGPRRSGGRAPVHSGPPAAAPPPGTGGLAGSALSPQTWKQAVEALRDRSARR